jgi:putative transcriptional regulator
MLDEWLVAYAAGTLNEGQSLLAACHLEFHPDLMATVHSAEAIGGALLNGLPDAELGDAALDAVLKRLDDREPVAVAGNAPALNEMPAPLASYIGGGYDRLHWRFLGPGLRHALLWRGPDGDKAWLLRGSGGQMIPEHGHAGEEWTLVLKGAYSASGQRFEAGDLEMADTSTHHAPQLDPADECICLAYTSGRIRPKSAVVRMMQPFIGL